MTPLNAIIIDDEEAAISILKMLIERNAVCIRAVASTTKPYEGITLIENYRPDVVFLDISMPEMSGFELLEKLTFKNFKLVFVSAHKQYAIEAIRNKASGYLLKPVDKEEFELCLTKILDEFKKDTNATKTGLIELPFKDGIGFVKQEDVIRLEADGNKTSIYLENNLNYKVSRNLGEFEELLKESVFFRCHKSHIINLQKVQKFISQNGFFALMTDGSMVDISKSNKDIFLELLKNI
jgi:two-component system, LytTR family, response regulator